MKKNIWVHWSLTLLAIAIFILTACSSGSSGDTAGLDESGVLTVSLTDAAGDFASYSVDVLSLTLTKANGAQVSTLPLSTRIDFAQYTEMTEFLTTATIPSGAYVAATLTLDYQNADIWVEDENGTMVQVTTILDDEGNPITTLEVSVRLEDRNHLVIAPGIPAHLLLDFDLKATNQVTFDDRGEPELTVDPFLVADVNRSESKIHRIRGMLNEVSVENSSFSVILRPFYCNLTGNHSRYGIRTVITNDETTYDIDGLQYQGQEGLLAIKGLEPLTAVVAVGDLKFNPLRFEASEVYAGSSVPGGTLDSVKGSVIARQGNTLTVQGATLIRSDSSIVFNDQVTIQLGENTSVTRQLSTDPFEKEDISIGQRVMVFGTMINSDPQALELDATEGYVRMLLTTLRGTVVNLDESNPTAQVTASLSSINGRQVDIFDFSGTGSDPANDADPLNYEISTGTLDLSPLGVDTPVKISGFAEIFGMAPPDFTAQTIVSLTDLRAYVRVHWAPPTNEAFESISSEGLTLNMEGAHLFHHLIRGWMIWDLENLPQAPSLVPQEDGQGLFVLKYRNTTQVFLTFDEFTAGLEGLLAEDLRVKKLGAVGTYDEASATLTAEMIEIRLN